MTHMQQNEKWKIQIRQNRRHWWESNAGVLRREHVRSTINCFKLAETHHDTTNRGWRSQLKNEGYIMCHLLLE